MKISMPTPRPPGVRCANVNEEQLVLAHNIQLPLGLYILGALGFRSTRIRSFRSTKLVLAYARTNFGSFQRYVQYELQYFGLLQRARASGRRAHKCI